MKRKTCADCGRQKSVNSFPAGYKGGPHSYCKKCFNRRSSEYYKKEADRIKYSRHKDERKSYTKDWRNIFGKGKSIWARTHKALRMGILVKHPFCDCCGNKFKLNKIEVHHLDNVNPLNVKMFCVGCHKNWHRKYGKGAKIIALIFLMLIPVISSAAAQPIETDLAVKAILGEAENQGYEGMLAVACGIRNRGTLRGVYGVKAKRPNTPGRIPAKYWEMARRAWAESEMNRIHPGDHWENVTAFGVPDWALKMKEVYRVKDHVFFATSKP